MKEVGEIPKGGFPILLQEVGQNAYFYLSINKYFWQKILLFYFS